MPSMHVDYWKMRPGLDLVRHVGVRNGRIEAVSEAPLAGRETMDATGLIVAPVFIISRPVRLP
jgi:hypothetical protein